jgi:hypothetical protein
VSARASPLGNRMIEDAQTILRPLIARYVPRLRAGVPIDLATYRAGHLACMARAGRPVTRRAWAETPLVMRVNHGRWCADCPCGASVTTGLGWTEARCFGCGAVFVAVAWPPEADREHITRALLRRPDARTRNWIPSEHWAGLVAENLAHGLAGAHREVTRC